jgi:hypothetical protein
MRGKALRFLHIVKHKNGTRSVPGCIPTRSVGNDQWAAGRDWSAVRPPSPASQLPQGSGYICRRLGGWQGVIAGRPAPTGFGVHLQEIGRLSGRHREQARSHRVRGTSAGDWSAVRAPSLAGQLLQGNGVHLRETGRQAGRHRWQASSHRGMGASARDWSAVRPPSPAGQLPQ